MKKLSDVIAESERNPRRKALLDAARKRITENWNQILEDMVVTDITDKIMEAVVADEVKKLDSTCQNDVDGLRIAASYFDRFRMSDYGDFLRDAANRYEILLEVYRRSADYNEQKIKASFERGRTPAEQEAALKWVESLRNSENNK